MTPDRAPVEHSLTDEDRLVLEAHGVSLNEASRQLRLLREPPPPIRLVGPCTAGNGIEVLADECPALLEAWRSAADAGRLVKLVPASGAATRMFASLSRARHAFADSRQPDPGDASDLATFLDRIDDFAFAPTLRDAAPRDGDEGLLDALLGEAGLDYGRLPKALIPFHRDGEAARAPVEEHLAESSELVRDATGHCAVHFTVPRGSEPAFRRRADSLSGDWDLGFSIQEPSTDTVAVDAEAAPFRVGGTLFMRPGGHGSLLVNLARLAAGSRADLVLVKNIDNVQPRSRRQDGLVAQRLLIGRLVELVDNAHQLVRRLAAADPSAIHDAVDFLETSFLPASTTALGLSREELSERLDRPIRVCGMVANAGETGGGPFWAADCEGLTTAQIVETAEVGPSSDQQAILSSSTHFNPVLMALSLRDFRGEPYELDRYVDSRRAFISDKNADGRPLQALEHPGLWNGSMAGWNTIFVEVPKGAFTPVKTVLDLLKAEHQPC